MGTVKHHGWSTSEDDIAHPVGIVFGRNLRKPALAAPDVSKPFGHDLCDVRQRLNDNCPEEDDQ